MRYAMESFLLLSYSCENRSRYHRASATYHVGLQAYLLKNHPFVSLVAMDFSEVLCFINHSIVSAGNARLIRYTGRSLRLVGIMVSSQGEESPSKLCACTRAHNSRDERTRENLKRT